MLKPGGPQKSNLVVINLVNHNVNDDVMMLLLPVDIRQGRLHQFNKLAVIEQSVRLWFWAQCSYLTQECAVFVAAVLAPLCCLHCPISPHSLLAACGLSRQDDAQTMQRTDASIDMTRWLCRSLYPQQRQQRETLWVRLQQGRCASSCVAQPAQMQCYQHAAHVAERSPNHMCHGDTQNCDACSRSETSRPPAPQSRLCSKGLHLHPNAQIMGLKSARVHKLCSQA